MVNHEGAFTCLLHAGRTSPSAGSRGCSPPFLHLPALSQLRERGDKTNTLPPFCRQPRQQVQRNHPQALLPASPVLFSPSLSKIFIFFAGAAYLSPRRDAFVIPFISPDPPGCSPRSISSAATDILIFLPLHECHLKSCRISGSIGAVWRRALALAALCFISPPPPSSPRPRQSLTAPLLSATDINER